MLDNKKDFLTALKTLIGDNTDDNTLDILDYANKIDSENESKLNEATERIKQLETEKSDLDKEWRKRYRDTFFNAPLPEQEKENKGAQNNDEPPENYPKTYDDLFTEKE